MFRKSNTQQQYPSRQNFLRLSGATLLAVTSLFLLAGCGGGGGNGNTGGGNGNTGGGSNSAIVGAYQITALGNTATGQTQPCPGTLAFGGNLSDDCGPAGVLTLNADGTGSTSQAGVITNTFTYTLVGNTLTAVTTDTTSHQATKDVFSAATSGNTVTLTRVSTTDPTNAVGEQLVLTKTSGGTTTVLPAGSYQGVYVATSGPFSPDAGTLAVTVSSTGAVNLSSFDYTGDGSTNNDTGTVNSNGLLVVSSGGNGITGTITQNPTTHVLSASFTESNGTKGVLTAGPAPTASPLAGSYSGTATNPAHTVTFPLTMTISPIGVVTATLGTPVAGNPNSGFNETGYVDTNGNLYLAYTSGRVPSISGGGLTLNGTALSGTIQETASDGSSSTGIFSLTKQ